SPWIRLGAAFVDGLILLPINWIFQKLILHTPSMADVAKAMQSGNPDAIKSLMPGIGSQILASVLGFAVFLAVNFVFLKNGQTVGKKLLKLQVQRRLDSAVLPIQDYLLKRLGPIYAVSFLGILISPFLNIVLLADALAIFRPGRNTLHDDIAGSKVVRLPA
ncbi:MAG: RDD family protein, partial [Chthoniobacteraceae bacterium]